MLTVLWLTQLSRRLPGKLRAKTQARPGRQASVCRPDSLNLRSGGHRPTHDTASRICEERIHVADTQGQAQGSRKAPCRTLEAPQDFHSPMSQAPGVYPPALSGSFQPGPFPLEKPLCADPHMVSIGTPLIVLEHVVPGSDDGRAKSRAACARVCPPVPRVCGSSSDALGPGRRGLAAAGSRSQRHCDVGVLACGLFFRLSF